MTKNGIPRVYDAHLDMPTYLHVRGNEAQLDKAKKNFFYVIIGAILILGAWVLATLIASTATQVLGGS